MRKLSHASRIARQSRTCIACGRSRPPKRFEPGAAICQYCNESTPAPAAEAARALRYQRSKAAESAAYQVTCAKCAKLRPWSYYPWIAGTAQRGDTCNACLRGQYVHKGGRPRLIPAAYRPGRPETWTAAKVQRVLEREQARRDEAARVLAKGKRCADCWHVKPAGDYRVITARRDGLSASCAACEAAYRVLQPAGQWRTARDALRKLATG